MVQHCGASSFKNSVLQLNLAAPGVVYGIWQERNTRVFRKQNSSSRALVAAIRSDLRACIGEKRRGRMKTD